MRWIKASERNPKEVSYSEIIWRRIGHIQSLPIRQFYADGEGLYKATPLGGRKDYILWNDLEWLDESIPASAEQEAEKLYPHAEGDSQNIFNYNLHKDAKREGYITAARQYMGEIEKLRAENSKLRKALEGLIADIKRKPNDTRYATAVGIATEALK